MPHIIASQLSDYDPARLVKTMEETYYRPLYQLCDEAAKLIHQLGHAGLMKPSFLYRSLCQRLLDKIVWYLGNRQVQLCDIPPAQGTYCKLEKTMEQSQHAGGTMETLSCSQVQRQIKELLFRIYAIREPLYTKAGHIKTYQSLRAAFLDIDTTISVLFYLEEAILIPKVGRFMVASTPDFDEEDCG